MSNILTEILAHKKHEVTIDSATRPLEALQELPLYQRKPHSLYERLKNGSGIIAEHKRQSPSKGVINANLTLQEVVNGYEKAEVSAISILTDEKYFGGGLQDLTDARNAVDTALLRKDFMIDAYQVHEAKAYGADAILLIAAALEEGQLLDLAYEANDIGLSVLLEVHDEEELLRFRESELLPIIGVNNRDLKKFKTTTEISKQLKPLIPAEKIAISESGIHDPETAAELADIGYDGFLIGEQFMKTNTPGQTCAAFIENLKQLTS